MLAAAAASSTAGQVDPATTTVWPAAGAARKLLRPSSPCRGRAACRASEELARSGEPGGERGLGGGYGPERAPLLNDIPVHGAMALFEMARTDV